MQQGQPDVEIVNVEIIELVPDWSLIVPIGLGLLAPLGLVVLAFLLRKRPPKRPDPN